MTAEGQAAAIAALRAAVQTQIAHWDAMNALERAFGYTGSTIPDNVADEFIEQVKSLAAASDDVDWIGEEELKSFITATGAIV